MPSWFAHIPRREASAAVLSVVLSIALMAVKFWAYFLTGSAAIFSDAMESIVNVAASAVAAYALWLAHSPADAEHPYGHGKVEFLSAGFEGGVIVAAAAIIAVKAVETLLDPAPIEAISLGAALIAISVVVNASAGAYLIRTGRAQQSLTLEADGHHLLSDAVTSAAALATLMVVQWSGWRAADPIGALVIAVYITWTGLHLLRRSAAGLMDRQDAEDERLLKRLLDSHVGPDGAEPRICSYHKLRHRHSGRYHWVDFHIMVPAGLTVDEGHRIASAIEYEIELSLGEGNATAHVEPCADSACPCRSPAGPITA